MEILSNDHYLSNKKRDLRESDEPLPMQLRLLHTSVGAGRLWFGTSLAGTGTDR